MRMRQADVEDSLACLRDWRGTVQLRIHCRDAWSVLWRDHVPPWVRWRRCKEMEGWWSMLDLIERTADG